MAHPDPGAGARASARVVAVDLGASNGRVFLVEIGEEQLELRQVHRFWNGGVRAGHHIHWDVLSLYHGVLEGLRGAGRSGRLDSIGIDSWGVDYGLLDADGALLGNPVHYRDDRTRDVVEPVVERVGAPELYRRSGIAVAPFNTIFQLVAGRNDALFPLARTLLLIPDLLAYWLTGSVGCEETNASTTQLLSVDGSGWDSELMDVLGIPPRLFPPIRRPGEAVGPLRPEVLAEAGLEHPLVFTAVGSHDTASAVAAVPAVDADFAYISSGTWSIVGVELDSPVLSEESRAAGFTNERGVDGSILYLRNVMGLWLLQESMRTWERAGRGLPLEELIASAAAGRPLRSVFDPNDPVFFSPGDIPARIARVCHDLGQPQPETPALVTRSILDSLALAYRRTLRAACELSGRRVEVIHVVGGGVNNDLLCQLTSDACGLPVVAGPVEAAAVGNALVQAQRLGTVGPDRWQARALVAERTQVRRHRPSAAAEVRWAEAEARLAAPGAGRRPT
ncbi:MAG: rhamnulokinase family protein [Acidimicrobiales bacterium]|jgi:rhamnulokinase